MVLRRVALKRLVTFDRLEDRRLLALTMSGTAFSAAQEQTFSGQVATVYDTDLSNTPTSFNSVQINWGDGQTTAGQIVGPLVVPGVFQVTGSHAYAAAGSYSTLISVSTTSGADASAAGTANISAPPFLVAVNTISTAPGTPLDQIVATFIAPNSPATLPASSSAIINWGDGQTTVGMIGGGPGAFTVTGQYTYTTAGTYTTSVTVALANGSTSTGTGQANIAYPSPYTPTSNLIVIPAYQPIDNGTLATFTGATGQTAADFTASINWGDGSTTPASVVSDPTMSGVFDVNGTHTYTNPGTYPIAIMVSDQIGNPFSITTTATVTTADLSGSTPPLTGGLDDVISNGPLAANGFTNTNRPTFSGTATPFSTVQLYARHFNADAELPLGEAVTSANGQWSLTVSPLAVGKWIFTATETPPGGYPSSMITLTNQNEGTVVYIDLSPKLVRWISHGEKAPAHPGKAVVVTPRCRSRRVRDTTPFEARRNRPRTRSELRGSRPLVVEDSPQLLGRDVAAAQDQSDGLAGEFLAPCHRGGDGRRARPFGDQLRGLDDQADGRGDLLVIDEHHLVDQAGE